MYLYELKPKSHFMLEENPKQPPGEQHWPHPDFEYEFEKIDGMYGICYDEMKNCCYFAAFTKVHEV